MPVVNLHCSDHFSGAVPHSGRTPDVFACLGVAISLHEISNSTKPIMPRRPAGADPAPALPMRAIVSIVAAHSYSLPAFRAARLGDAAEDVAALAAMGLLGS